MKRWWVGLLVLATSPALTQQSLAQQTVPVIPFESVPNPLKLPPNMYFGEASGVSVNSKGHVFVLSRGNTSGPAYAAAATQLLEFDAKGQFVREIGKNLYAWSFGHTVKIDPQDNIWVTDKGSDMVIKFDPEGRVVMVFGRKQEASDEDTEPLKHPKPPLPAEDGKFRQVTDVAWDKAGDTFISDGYINSRVAKVDKDGNWLKSWGDRGKEPGQFNTPHSIATDANDNVYVADRGNSRIQVFDRDGKFLRQIVIDVPVPPDAKPAIGKIPDEAMMAAARSIRVRRGRSASRRRRIRCSTARTPGPAASTSSASMARCSACSANPASSSNNSAGSTRWPARRKTRSTPLSC
jgi:NHL repeat